MIEVSRRSLITGIGCIIAAPAIVRASSLMKVKVPKLSVGVDPRLTSESAWYMVDGKVWLHPSTGSKWIAAIESDIAAREAWAQQYIVGYETLNVGPTARRPASLLGAS